MSMSPLTADIWSRLAWPPASSTRAVVPSAKMSNPTSRYRLFSSSDMSSKRVINYVSSFVSNTNFGTLFDFIVYL